VSLRRGNNVPDRTKQIQARARVQRATRLVLPGAQSALRRRYERRAIFIAAGDHESGRDIGGVLAPKQREISFKYAPQADTGHQPAIIEQEARARGPVCADALAAVHGQQHTVDARLVRPDHDDPLSVELLSEKSLFYRARRRHREWAGQRMRSL
jgi:hypothetical protein